MTTRTLQEIREHIKATKHQWKAPSEQHPTAYGFVRKNGDYDDHMQVICLGGLSGGVSQIGDQSFYIYHRMGPDASSLNGAPDGASKAWLEWMLSPTESPWRDIIQGNGLTIGEHQSFDDVAGNGLVLSNRNFPCNYFVNFLTAFRMCNEKNMITRIWNKLVKAGATRGSAITACAFVHNQLNTGYDDKRYLGTMVPFNGYGYQGHFAFSPWTCDDLGYAWRVNNSRPVKSAFLSHTFAQNGQSLPVNVVWGGISDGNYSVDGALANLFWSFARSGESGKALSGSQELRHSPRMFKNPIPYKEPSQGKPQFAPFENILKFCLYLDSLTPGKDFQVNVDN